MLVSLVEIKEYLGVTDNSNDAFLKSQEAVISQSVENYCGRQFGSQKYIQNFYQSDFDLPTSEIPLYNYPVTEVSSVLDGGSEVVDDCRIQKSVGIIVNPSGFFLLNSDLVIKYTAGYVEIPAPVKSVILSLIEERYNKKTSGVSLNFGSDVQSVSIPGTISVAYDYSLQSNERKTAFGTILGNYVNVLDFYRSERNLIGSCKPIYSEVGE